MAPIEFVVVDLKTKMRSALILTVVFILLSANASAQVPCTHRDKIVPWLAAKYKEIPVAMALDSRGGLVEVLSSKHGHTWTIIVTSPDGVSCVVTAGENWRTQRDEDRRTEPQA